MKTKNWREAPVAGAIWRRNGGRTGWMKGKGDEATENYTQIIDDEEVTVACGFPDGPSFWVRANRKTGKVVVLRDGKDVVLEATLTPETMHELGLA